MIFSECQSLFTKEIFFFDRQVSHRLVRLMVVIHTYKAYEVRYCYTVAQKRSTGTGEWGGGVGQTASMVSPPCRGEGTCEFQ
jgi:hypothetical protein